MNSDIVRVQKRLGQTHNDASKISIDRFNFDSSADIWRVEIDGALKSKQIVEHFPKPKWRKIVLGFFGRLLAHDSKLTVKFFWESFSTTVSHSSRLPRKQMARPFS